jgi:hypothetical protein
LSGGGNRCHRGASVLQAGERIIRALNASDTSSLSRSRSKEMSPMTTTSRSHPFRLAVRRAARALRNTGAQARDGLPLRDIRCEPVGGFAGPIGPDAPVGTFASTVVLRRQCTGTFAGDPDQQRQGSFGDVER